MRISEVIRRKGDQVVTVSRGASVADLIEMLVEHHIGAAVVTDDSGAVEGIVSERDVVLALRDGGPGTREVTVGQIMTADVMTCVPEDDTETLARTMTEKRVRHLPVLVDGRLAGIVSIGDIVKQRLDELQLERDELVNYVQR